MVSRFLTFLPNAVILQLDPPAMAPNEATNEALDLYYQTVFSSFRTWKEQLDFFVRVCTRSPPFSPVVVVARYLLFQLFVGKQLKLLV